MSRIPKLKDDSVDAMYVWWRQMAKAGLAFHPDDGAEDIGNGTDGVWLRTFTDDEAKEVDKIVHGVHGMHTTHGDLIYQAALQATEEPDITAARFQAIFTWNDDDISVPPHAEVEKVEGATGWRPKFGCLPNESAPVLRSARSDLRRTDAANLDAEGDGRDPSGVGRCPCPLRAFLNQVPACCRAFLE